jgi:hypothetical protein
MLSLGRTVSMDVARGMTCPDVGTAMTKWGRVSG